MSVSHPNLEILGFTVNYEDGTKNEIPVKGSKSIEFKIPEDTTYQTTIHFLVKEKTLNKLKYKQEVKAFGMVVRSREVFVGEQFAPRDTPYDVTFDKDCTPKGMILRGEYNCVSTYYADGEVLFQSPWKLNVTKK
ncbi:E set domain-containing protein [Metschnikowia bicuspidata var. bicuspidata NRRL YB-4993]|uniref:E set domain-containing protein n=1 Tax=Metschnikowia bicuspidata var. bicuspidata NRRL YB-4993 TaxID=869754 RepID=A0A1A0H5E1_9ASCO|nr:E set domain-containing protein [Metschnikowia bicuspidata var. bicuspidata NRRL YB-4993]OBA19138.1 E set domain-containing protein [Metschnikowia bicuspidata var. bicuspidata NRRL YB-4993]